MDTTQKILLNNSNNKKKINENSSLNVLLSGNKKLLPEGTIEETLNSYEVYLDERKKSNKFRLSVSISPYCTNVLFNPFTEIVKDEGKPNVVCLNYEEDYKEKNVIGKDSNFIWNQFEAIRDTQLSNETCGFEYHCGIDIFNNHILRNKTFKAVNYNSINSTKSTGKLDTSYGRNFSKVKVNEKSTPHVYVDNNFNTIDDYMRDKNGWIISEHFPKIVKKGSEYSNLETIILPLHLYQNYDILSFKECIKEKLLDDNGWYGFSNPSTLGVTTLEDWNHTEAKANFDFGTEPYLSFCDDVENINVTTSAVKEMTDYSKMDINKVINNKNYCDYIDMYPGRDLYSFTPKYNEERKRIEKNWNYCLTYPSNNVIKNYDKNFPFLNIDTSGNTSLKVYMFDESTFDDDGTQLVTIYTISQHGLIEGDMVNIYKSNDIFYESAEVIHVIDKYIFQIVKSSGNMSNYWVEVGNRYSNGVTLTNPFKYSENEKAPYPQVILNGILRVGEQYYPICESNRCNVDPDAQNIHIRRVVNGVECKYYVRKFSRLPNFKFKDEEVNDYTLYDDNYAKNSKKKRRAGDLSLNLIDRFSNPSDKSSEFENHIGKLGFANTSYGDDNTEIVFTDDIDVSYLRDNLGRPLSDIYITIIKNNKGYKEWYGINKPIAIGSVNVEYSHCFGKINSSFLFSDYYRESYLSAPNFSSLYDVRDITASGNNIKSLITKTDKVSKDANFEDEIEFEKDWEYYGDICCFSPVDCDEQIIQTAMHRFNTVQREMGILGAKAFKNFNNGELNYNEIYDVENTLLYAKTNKGDPYDNFKNGSDNPKQRKDITTSDAYLYHTTKEKIENVLNFSEGYFYQPHYRINLKTISNKLSTDSPIEYDIASIEDPNKTTENGRKLYEVKTSNENSFQKNEKLALYKKSTNEYYFVTVYELIDWNRFICTIANENGTHIGSIEGIFDIKNITDYILVKKHSDTPSYARLIKDGSCRYCWREVISNGLENGEKGYPFTNGAFYINKQINFFLRRQDPKKINLGYKNGTFDYVPDGEKIDDYPNFIPNYKTNFEPKEIRKC